MVSARNGAETGMSTGHEAAAGNRDRGSALTASGSDVSAKRRSELRFGRGYEYRMSRQRASGSPAGQPSQNEAR
ncbi:MAG TPA: hypothetical protein ENK05_02405 [Gammaproteobacteria bacterium]|nr:hypothetical protein [Gammaproteobacteria bacterium]